MAQDILIGRDMYFKRTDDCGNVTFEFTRVWDYNGFIEKAKAEAKKEKAKKKGNKNDFEAITKEEYRAAKSKV